MGTLFRASFKTLSVRIYFLMALLIPALSIAQGDQPLSPAEDTLAETADNAIPAREVRAARAGSQREL